MKGWPEWATIDPAAAVLAGACFFAIFVLNVVQIAMRTFGGGGFLSYDEPNGRYAGILQLEALGKIRVYDLFDASEADETDETDDEAETMRIVERRRM